MRSPTPSHGPGRTVDCGLWKMRAALITHSSLGSVSVGLGRSLGPEPVCHDTREACVSVSAVTYSAIHKYIGSIPRLRVGGSTPMGLHGATTRAPQITYQSQTQPEHNAQCVAVGKRHIKALKGTRRYQGKEPGGGEVSHVAQTTKGKRCAPYAP